MAQLFHIVPFSIGFAPLNVVKISASVLAASCPYL
jgi:hypothetical protein